MKVGIIEYGGELNKIFQKEVGEKVETVYFEVKKALDLFDVLAYAKKMATLDQLVIIVNKTDEKELNAFYDGLAFLEAETGKNIFKCIYDEEENGESLVKELAESFVKNVFG